MLPPTPLPPHAENDQGADPSVACTTCREPIRAGAKKCIHCDSFQDWRGKLTVSSSVLALLVALVSVLGATLPAWKTAFATHDSRVRMFFTGVVSNNTLRVMFSNSGDRPAGILKAWLLVKKSREYIPLESGREIPADYSRIDDVFTTAHTSLAQLKDAEEGCVLGIEVVSFRGEKSTSRMDISNEMCRTFMNNILDWRLRPVPAKTKSK